jgi:uncharacterized SAM-binding protein YcdF (DUF218 family)
MPDARPPVIRRSRLHRCRWLIRAAYPVLIVCLLWLAREPLMIWLAQAWIVNDPLQKSDAIVVLGGGVNRRPFEAARLYRAGYAPRILIMQVKIESAERMGVARSETDVIREILLQKGIPATAIEVIGHQVSSTYEESLALRDWVQKNALTSGRHLQLILPTDLFHSRRVRWIFNRQLKKSDVALSIEALPQEKYSALNWWRQEDGLLAFQNEIVKYVYYRIKY